MSKRDVLLFVGLCVVAFVCVGLLMSVVVNGAGVSKTLAEARAAESQATLNESKAREADANARLLSQKSITEEQTRNKEKWGWTAVTVNENLGAIGMIGSICPAFLVIMLVIGTVLFLASKSQHEEY